MSSMAQGDEVYDREYWAERVRARRAEQGLPEEKPKQLLEEAGRIYGRWLNRPPVTLRLDQ